MWKMWLKQHIYLKQYITHFKYYNLYQVPEGKGSPISLPFPLLEPASQANLHYAGAVET